MTVTRESGNTWWEPCPSATLSTTNPTRIGLASNPCHLGERPATWAMARP